MAGTVIITGSAGSLGLALAELVINRAEPLTPIFTVRSQKAANAQPLKALVEAKKQKTAETRELDLSNLDAVRAFARDINERVSANQLPLPYGRWS
ncbi:Short-chain dehydrogenase/reductase SDR [Macrophomina phaseolina MS6]|uniref:Short-chain dehydrogenase/reductase SDR n=1 Tax=Macrophomina phaseolina (strain MS6) TaxID=1126212 RepID=K2T103_MACPH|nr:Short-chain dehydrogenase/reductase SDR [Macrophomina phaseolina MS6]